MNVLDLSRLPLYWEMVNAEKIALLNLLSDIKPVISIEIGSKEGGSLQLISQLSKTVYSLDIDPSVKNLSEKFSNVNFIIGDSKVTLPLLLKDLHNKNEQPDFILIDGDHSAEGVKNDIENILKLKTTKPLVILMHDSFNPICRKGLLPNLGRSRHPPFPFLGLRSKFRERSTRLPIGQSLTLPS